MDAVEWMLAIGGAGCLLLLLCLVLALIIEAVDQVGRAFGSPAVPRRNLSYGPDAQDAVPKPPTPGENITTDDLRGLFGDVNTVVVEFDPQGVMTQRYQLTREEIAEGKDRCGPTYTSQCHSYFRDLTQDLKRSDP